MGQEPMSEIPKTPGRSILRRSATDFLKQEAQAGEVPLRRVQTDGEQVKEQRFDDKAVKRTYLESDISSANIQTEKISANDALLSDADITSLIMTSKNDGLIGTFQEISSEEQPRELNRWRIRARALCFDKDELGGFMALSTQEQQEILSGWNRIRKIVKIQGIDEWESLESRMERMKSSPVVIEPPLPGEVSPTGPAESQSESVGSQPEEEMELPESRPELIEFKSEEEKKARIKLLDSEMKEIQIQWKYINNYINDIKEFSKKTLSDQVSIAKEMRNDYVTKQEEERKVRREKGQREQSNRDDVDRHWDYRSNEDEFIERVLIEEQRSLKQGILGGIKQTRERLDKWYEVRTSSGTAENESDIQDEFEEKQEIINNYSRMHWDTTFFEGTPADKIPARKSDIKNRYRAFMFQLRMDRLQDYRRYQDEFIGRVLIEEQRSLKQGILGGIKEARARLDKWHEVCVSSGTEKTDLDIKEEFDKKQGIINDYSRMYWDTTFFEGTPADKIPARKSDIKNRYGALMLQLRMDKNL